MMVYKHTSINNAYIFDEKKLTQATAFFIYKSQGSINILKLMKLLYLSERLSFQKFHEPLIGDSLVSMKNGPVLSLTLNYINGEMKRDEYWENWISDRENHAIALKDPSIVRDEDDLLELSENDIDVLNQIWVEFGHKERWDLVHYTHTNCSEWRDPGSSAYPIEYNALFNSLGFSEALKSEIFDHLAQQVELNKQKNICS